MFNLLKSIRSYRSILTNTNRSIYNKSNHMVMNAQELRQITNNVNDTFKNRCFQEMYNKVEHEITRLKHSGKLTEAAKEGYSRFLIFDSHDVRNLLPPSKQLKVCSHQYINDFISLYPELQGFKLVPIENRWSNKVSIAIEW